MATSSRALALALAASALLAVYACFPAIAGTTDRDMMHERQNAGQLAVQLRKPPSAASIDAQCTAGCTEDITGRYTVRADSCYEWGSNFPHGYIVSKLPNFVVIPAEPATIVISEGPSQRTFYFKMDPPPDAQAAKVLHVDGNVVNPLCTQCVQRDSRSPGNLGGGIGGFYWTMRRSARGPLLYAITLQEARLVGPPKVRRMECTFPPE